MTPHKHEKSYENPPVFLKVLKQHCDEKQKAGVQSNKILKEGKPASMIVNYSSVNISPLGPEHSECFAEVFKLQNKLKEVSPLSFLYSNRKKYNL